MTTSKLWDRGDSTIAFAEKATGACAEVLRHLNIKIVRYEADAPRTVADDFIGVLGKPSYYRIILDGKVVAERCEMPRDVWNILLGIAAGRDIPTVVEQSHLKQLAEDAVCLRLMRARYQDIVESARANDVLDDLVMSWDEEDYQDCLLRTRRAIAEIEKRFSLKRGNSRAAL
mgnify:CR=1 FL=1